MKDKIVFTEHYLIFFTVEYSCAPSTMSSTKQTDCYSEWRIFRFTWMCLMFSKKSASTSLSWRTTRSANMSWDGNVSTRTERMAMNSWRTVYVEKIFDNKFHKTLKSTFHIQSRVTDLCNIIHVCAFYQPTALQSCTTTTWNQNFMITVLKFNYSLYS